VGGTTTTSRIPTTALFEKLHRLEWSRPWPALLEDSSADGTGSAAQFYYPYGVAADTKGNVYVADTIINHP